jgi:hypothetical protein
VSLLDTNENKGEIWEVKHALLLFVRIRVRVRVFVDLSIQAAEEEHQASKKCRK